MPVIGSKQTKFGFGPPGLSASRGCGEKTTAVLYLGPNNTSSCCDFPLTLIRARPSPSALGITMHELPGRYKLGSTRRPNGCSGQHKISRCYGHHCPSGRTLVYISTRLNTLPHAPQLPGSLVRRSTTPSTAKAWRCCKPTTGSISSLLSRRRETASQPWSHGH